MNQTSDIEIRSALHKKKLREFHLCSQSIVIDELGIEHGRKRIDIAVLNGKFHGYEIKSSVDKLDRLPEQVEVYLRSIQKLSIVAAEKHIPRIEQIVPDECGVILATKGSRGAINFATIKKARLNRNLDFNALSHLLWREEVVEALEGFKVKPQEMRVPRAQLYKVLEEHMSISELLSLIKAKLMARANWRVDQLPM